MTDLSYDLSYGPQGPPVDDGLINHASLTASLERLSEAAQTDLSVSALVDAVNQTNKAQLDENGEKPFIAVANRPELALLKMFGAIKPYERIEMGPINSGVDESTAKKFGQQILADSHMVQGLIIPGRNEVSTAEGIMRTRGMPRAQL